VLLVVVAAASLAAFLGDTDGFVARAGFIPARLSGVATDYAAVPAWLTPLTSALLHGGYAHLGMNLLMLGFTGQQTERAIGPVGLAVLIVLGAYAAAVGQWLPDPMSARPMIGASGAISAVVGAYAMLYGQPRARAIGPLPARAVHVLWLLAAWTIVNVMMGLAFAHQGVAVATAAHVGGFVAGLALARPLLRFHWRKA
jgi:membrane associated rhomboid family serine protease